MVQNKNMKISVLTPDLSHNCLGRAHLLAKVLQRHYEVEIIGPIFGDGVWSPVADDKSIEYKSVKIYGSLKPYGQIKKLVKKITGDVIYASKPVFSSFGVGLLKKLINNTPLILDIDDWEMGFVKERCCNLSFSRRFKSLLGSFVYLYSMDSYWNNLFGEKLANLADKITVSNIFLQKKFGGEILWHARNTDFFNPERFDKDLIRQNYEIDKHKKVVIFLGTPRSHKGIEDLIKAVTMIKNPEIMLVIVGIDDKNQYCKNLVKIAKKMLNKKITVFGVQPFEKCPELLAMADIVAIPQRKKFATVGQMPVKVIDAMAMAKPIIATDVCDLPKVLDECGWIVEPENAMELAKAIEYVLDNPNEAEEKGLKARQECIEKYSFDAIEKVLVKMFSTLS